jgi:hypothetical protein
VVDGIAAVCTGVFLVRGMGNDMSTVT